MTAVPPAPPHPRLPAAAVLRVERLTCRHDPYAVLRLLDGAGGADGAGAHRPVALCGAWAGGGALVTSEPAAVAAPDEDPFAVVDRQPVLGAGPPVPARAVGGGWFGYFGYRLTRRLEHLRVPEPPEAGTGARGLPDAGLAFYDHLLRYDRAEDRWYYEWLDSPERRPTLARWRERVLALLAGPPPARASFVLGPMRAPDPAGHVARVERCIRAIRRGDIFQANICTRLTGPFHGSTADAWALAAERLRPARGAYLSGPHGAVLSLSPELFLRRDGRAVHTAPIKGTRPRTGADDAAEARVLAGSAKDSAENVMIVDLMRNDLGRVCTAGSVLVPELLSVEPHPGVWHLVSYVTGRLPDAVTDGTLLRAAFPPGSVTGAPKVRALEVIDELESVRRGVYTGAIGYVGPRGLELSVAIRTLEVRDGVASLGVGGGITAESTPAEEWAECLVKAGPLLAAWGARPVAAAPRPPGLSDPADGVFETLLAVDGVPLDLADHLGRLRRSYWEVYRGSPAADLELRVRQACRGRAGRHRVEVRLRPGAPAQVTVEPLPGAGPVPLAAQPGLHGVLAAAPDGLEPHKFTDRRWLERAEAEAPGDAAVVFHDRAGRLLEASRDALLCVRDGTLVTAPLDGRVLPGVTRGVLLDLADDLGIGHRLEHVLLDRVPDLDGAFLANTLRGVRWLRSLGGHAWPRPDPVTGALCAALLDHWQLPARGTRPPRHLIAPAGGWRGGTGRVDAVAEADGQE